MDMQQFLSLLTEQPEMVEFEQTMAVIDDNYRFEPTAFSNGNIENEAGQNNGSCKIFSFAQLNDLNEQQTLACFGAFYRVDVLNNPTGTDHGNIRNFIEHGWPGVKFERAALEKN